MPFNMDDFVSRETIEKIKVYETLLKQWNRRTALVQEDTIPSFYSRHVLDSLQLIPIIKNIFTIFSSGFDSLDTKLISIDPNNTLFKKNTLPNTSSKSQSLSNKTQDINSSQIITSLSILDVGAGAGFPGMILAISGFLNVTLCESNTKKCVFLEEVARQTSTIVTIKNERVENLQKKYDIVVSRACMDLSDLCDVLKNVSRETMSVGIFHKGRSWKDEVNTARKKWDFKMMAYQSITSEDSVVLCLRDLKKI